MTDGVNNDFGLGDFVKDEIRIRQRRQPTNGRILGANADLCMTCKERDDALYARLDAIGALRRMLGNVVGDQTKIGECRGGVANLHRPCLAQMERTCSSEANSPRADAALELAMAARSSSDSGTGCASPPPASSRTIRAMSSCTSGGRSRTASSA